MKTKTKNQEKIIVKKYNGRAIFKTKQSRLKLPKEKEQEIKKLIKQIDELGERLDILLK
jgi:hypothetical protein